MRQENFAALLFELRKEKGYTQKQLAELLQVSDKTVSKWERAAGLPDISILPKLSEVFSVSVETLLSGKRVKNPLVVGNMQKIKFYICPSCGNLLTATDEAAIFCCGSALQEAIPQKADTEHMLLLEPCEDELFVTAKHPMRKDHYIAFAAFVTGDKIMLQKLYPEWDMQFRLHSRNKHGKLYSYCTQHGLFCQMF